MHPPRRSAAAGLAVVFATITTLVVAVLGPAPAGAAPAAPGDVTVTAGTCTPNPVDFGATTTCPFTITNHSTTSTTVDLTAQGDGRLTVSDADLGATVGPAGVANASGITLAGGSNNNIGLVPGSPTGYIGLGVFNIPSVPWLADDAFHSQDLSQTRFRWNGAVYEDLGISANGYAVAGPTDAAQDSTPTPQDLPDGARPNNVLAPFWTDLAPGEDTGLRIAHLNTAGDPGQRSVFLVVEWRLHEKGTTTLRGAQLWIRTEDPLAPGTVPPEEVFFTYDNQTMTAAPVRPFRVGAESADGTSGAHLTPGQLPSSGITVRTDVPPTPGQTITWNVTAAGTGAGAGSITAEVSSPLLPTPAAATAAAVVNQRSVIVAVAADPPAPTAGQAVAFTATLAPPDATGTVQFAVDGAPLGEAVPVTGGTATSPTTTLAAGDHTVTATYSGDTDHAGTVGTATVSVGKTATTTSLAVAPTTPLATDPVTFTATVAPVPAGGTVQFTLDDEPVGSPVPVVDGVATSAPVGPLAIGDHVVAAAYGGDDTHAASTGGPETFTVSRVTTTTTVTVSTGPLRPGDPVTFTASVAPAGASGTVQFAVDGAPVGAPVPLVSGVATSEAYTAVAGTRTVTAAYAGDDTHHPSTSAGVTFPVTEPTTTTVASATDLVVLGESFEVAITVAPAPPAGSTARLLVDGAESNVSPVALDADGRATVAVPAADLVAGSPTLEAVYDGSDTHRASSGTTTVTVLDPAAPGAVRAGFRAVLGRDPDPAGLRFWRDRLADDLTFETYVRLLARSAEGRGRLVDTAYARALGRGADPGGRAYWSERSATTSGAELLTALASSAEGHARAGGTAGGYVRSLYQLHLGRAGAGPEVAWWVGQLGSPGDPGARAALSRRIAATPEATDVAVTGALVAGCGTPTTTEAARSSLAARWRAVGGNPHHLAGLAVALACPPPP